MTEDSFTGSPPSSGEGASQNNTGAASPQPPAPGPAPGPEQPQPSAPRLSALAVAALAVAILSLCGGVLAVPGLILGIVALADVKRSMGRLTGRGLAIAAICVSGFMMVVSFAILPAILYPVFARAREAARKQTCMSNLRQITLACIMYAQDHDEVYPACVASDTQGTAHAVGGVYANRTRRDFGRQVEARYGARYADGRWMWQLPDLLRPYIKDDTLFNCPTLVRRDARFHIQTYVVGTEKQSGKPDARDPLRPLIPGKRKLKTWQSGSYIYMCAHHPYGAGVEAAAYGEAYGAETGIALLSLWDAANRLGVIGEPNLLDAANPQAYLPCANPVGMFDDPQSEPLVACNSLGVHEGYSLDYLRMHVVPLHAAAAFGLGEDQVNPPTMPVATPVGFADGHVKYYRAGLEEMLALCFSRNSGEQGERGE